ncbi:MAG: helix-turn-helix transcriptional regulator [bacterium]|nr:helix-turn-helix transcriptional regulator [bacterium]
MAKKKSQKGTQRGGTSTQSEDPFREMVLGSLAQLRRRLRDKISDRGFSQAQVAARLGWDSSTLSKILCGRMVLRVEHLLSICAAIGIQLVDLVTDLPELPAPSTEPVTKQDLRRLLRTREHPARVLGPVDAGALKAAVQQWQPRNRPERAYLAKVLEWCECSLETDRRAARRRAAGGTLHQKALDWPKFDGE